MCYIPHCDKSYSTVINIFHWPRASLTLTTLFCVVVIVCDDMRQDHVMIHRLGIWKELGYQNDAHDIPTAIVPGKTFS